MWISVSLGLRQLSFQSRDAGFQLLNFIDQTRHHLQRRQKRLKRAGADLTAGTGPSHPRTLSLQRSTPGLLLLFSSRV